MTPCRISSETLSGSVARPATITVRVRFVGQRRPSLAHHYNVRLPPFPDARRKKTPQKAALSVRATGQVSAFVAAHIAKLLLGRHPLNHLCGIATFGVQFERNLVVADGRLVSAPGHGGLSKGIPCVRR